MEDIFKTVVEAVIKQFGLGGLFAAVPLLGWVIEYRRHGQTAKQLVAEREARVTELKEALPIISQSTAASQTVAAGLVATTETVGKLETTVRELILSSIRRGPD